MTPHHSLVWYYKPNKVKVSSISHEKRKKQKHLFLFLTPLLTLWPPQICPSLGTTVLNDHCDILLRGFYIKHATLRISTSYAFSDNFFKIVLRDFFCLRNRRKISFTKLSNWLRRTNQEFSFSRFSTRTASSPGTDTPAAQPRTASWASSSWPMRRSTSGPTFCPPGTADNCYFCCNSSQF